MCDHYIAPGTPHYCNDGNFDFSSHHTDSLESVAYDTRGVNC
jgi:hypothetical protein